MCLIKAKYKEKENYKEEFLLWRNYSFELTFFLKPKNIRRKTQMGQRFILQVKLEDNMDSVINEYKELNMIYIYIYSISNQFYLF